MKKTLNIILSLLIFVSFSLCVSSQSSQKGLDQVMLAKQFLGIWKTEVGNDIILIMEVVPSGEGLDMTIDYKSQGKTYATGCSVLGFTVKKESLVICNVYPSGNIVHDIGKFVTEKKLVMERFFPDQPNHAVVMANSSNPTPLTLRHIIKSISLTLIQYLYIFTLTLIQF